MANCLVHFFTEPCLLFTIIGKLGVGYVALRVLYKAWQLIKLYLLSPSLGLALDPKTFGKWAVVTGATDGIGKSYAELLAKKGMKLVLISRTESKLVDTAKEIEGKYEGVEVRWVVADFGDIAVYGHIRQQLEGLDIGVLVNNVGMSYEAPFYPHELSEEEVRKMLVVNMFSVVYMTRLVLERMIDSNRGLIINIASLAARIPAPLLSVYGATKAFMRSLSKSMQIEYRDNGIVVQSVSPGVVATKMSKITNASFFIPGPSSFANSALSTVGLDNDVAGCLGHELLTTAASLAGDKLTGDYLLSYFMKARKKGQLKNEREDAKSKSQ